MSNSLCLARAFRRTPSVSRLARCLAVIASGVRAVFPGLRGLASVNSLDLRPGTARVRGEEAESWPGLPMPAASKWERSIIDELARVKGDSKGCSTAPAVCGGGLDGKARLWSNKLLLSHFVARELPRATTIQRNWGSQGRGAKHFMTW